MRNLLPILKHESKAKLLCANRRRNFRLIVSFVHQSWISIGVFKRELMFWHVISQNNLGHSEDSNSTARSGVILASHPKVIYSMTRLHASKFVMPERDTTSLKMPKSIHWSNGHKWGEKGTGLISVCSDKAREIAAARRGIEGDSSVFSNLDGSRDKAKSERRKCLEESRHKEWGIISGREGMLVVGVAKLQLRHRFPSVTE